MQKSTKAASEKAMVSKGVSTLELNKKVESKESGVATSSIVRSSGMKIGSILRTMAEVSRFNYLSTQSLDVVTSSGLIKRGNSAKSMTSKRASEREKIQDHAALYSMSDEDPLTEQFPDHITPLLNEDQLWGCFYICPEIYSDVYSPTVRIRSQDDVPELTNGFLTRDLISTCLSYLKRIPILGDFVYIKLDLSAKLLGNIDVLQHYKYLVYLDLSSNLLKELTTLSHLPYLQLLSVAYNKLSAVLEYETPQWFLTEVHYKFNSVTKIRDLSAFWSITILDLSHNNIKSIKGVENLRYLRRLDLSFNHIQRLENLNHMRLLWLDVSYNNISSFEMDATTGLWTLLDLEYLNLSENNLASMKIFSRCTRLRELHVRNNRLGVLLELAVYMHQMRRLGVVDLRGNPLCTTPGYKEVVLTSFPMLLWLDAKELDPVEQRKYKMNMSPDVYTFATRRLLRLLYIEQLSRSRVSPHTPPADTTEPSIVVLVGYEAVGKGKLARRLVEHFSAHVERGYLHTTAPYHTPGHYKQVTRTEFDDMLVSGEFLAYSEMNGESYGLSREEATVKGYKVKIVCMDLVSGLMLALRGLRPYLILVTTSDKGLLAAKQKERKGVRNDIYNDERSLETPLGKSSLQNLLSGRFMIAGMLNKILLTLPEGKEKEEFVLESDCSLLIDSDARLTSKCYRRDINPLNSLSSSATTTESCKQAQESSQIEQSFHIIYKDQQSAEEFEDHKPEVSYRRIPRPKSVDFTNRHASSAVKVPEGSKSSKSVTFTSQEQGGTEDSVDPTGVINSWPGVKDDKKKTDAYMSTKTGSKCQIRHTDSGDYSDGSDLWHAFLIETGLYGSSSDSSQTSDTNSRDNKTDDTDSILTHLAGYHSVNFGKRTLNTKDDYEDIHQTNPGIFWDTVNTDSFEDAFRKVKMIIQNIVLSQPKLQPMYDIDFTNLSYYPTVAARLKKICSEITPMQHFY